MWHTYSKGTESRIRSIKPQLVQAHVLQTVRLMEARLHLQGRCDFNVVARRTQAHLYLTVVAAAPVKSSKNLTSLTQQSINVKT